MSIWSEEVFVINEVKNTVPQTYVINELNDTFYEKELQKTNQQEFRIEKVLKRKGDKLYVKWKVYATKADIKNNSHVDTSNFALKPNLASLKTEVDKSDINKFKNLPNNLSNLKK